MVWTVNATPRLLYHRERTGAHYIGSWVGRRASLEGLGKSRPLLGFDPRTVQPVASHYTHSATPAHVKSTLFTFNYNFCFTMFLLTINHHHR